MPSTFLGGAEHDSSAPAHERAEKHRCIRFKKAKEKEKANKGARGMPVALGGDEGRDKLRKAAARGKCPVTRRCPNGETRRERSRHHTH